MRKFKPDKMLELFHQNFNGETFDALRDSIREVIKKASCLNGLIKQLQSVQHVQYVELDDECEFDNKDFDSDYIESEPDSCDFSVLHCYAELDRNKMETKSQYVEVCFFIVWNDVRKQGWIDAAMLALADNPQNFAEPLCFFDINTHNLIKWCSELNND